MCEFEFHCWKLGEYTENMAGYILMKYPTYFSLKMKREKSIFHFEKQNLEHIGNSVHTAEYLAFRKALLSVYN